MMDRIISDIDKALGAEAYMAALSLMLTLPDICAKAEYGKQYGNKKRYITWFDEYIGQYEKPPQENGEAPMPYLSGEVVYQLRCMILHQGTPNIDSKEIREDACKIDHFTLVTESKNEFDIYTDAASYGSDFDSNTPIRTYRLNIRRFWLVLKSCVLAYYKDNEEKFTFFQYSILDWDKAIEDMHKSKKILFGGRNDS